MAISHGGELLGLKFAVRLYANTKYPPSSLPVSNLPAAWGGSGRGRDSVLVRPCSLPSQVPSTGNPQTSSGHHRALRFLSSCLLITHLLCPSHHRPTLRRADLRRCLTTPSWTRLRTSTDRKTMLVYCLWTPTEPGRTFCRWPQKSRQNQAHNTQPHPRITKPS